MTKEASVENIQAATFQEEVITGLQERKKRLSPKHFYDAQGAYLFDQITETDDYYLTSAELEILQHHGGDIAEKLGEHCRFIEFGSGSVG